MEGDEGSSSSFPIGETAQEKGFSHVPECYKLPASQNLSLDSDTANVHVVDLAKLKSSTERSNMVKDIRNACCTAGCFQIINHGIAQSVLDDALEMASDFFQLPTKEKAKFMSNDVYKPVRYGTSLKDGSVDKLRFGRVFLKHYAHPLNQWIDHWPTNPPNYRAFVDTQYCTLHN